MEHWKRNIPSFCVGDSKEDPIVVSNGEEVEAPPLAECIGPVYTGQQAVHSSPRYKEVREQRRREKSKAKRMEPVKGTRAVRKRVAEQAAERERGAKLLNGSPLKRSVLLLHWGHMNWTVMIIMYRGVR